MKQPLILEIASFGSTQAGLVDASSLSSSASVKVQFRGVSVPSCVRVSDQLPAPVLGHTTVAARYRQALYPRDRRCQPPGVTPQSGQDRGLKLGKAKLLETAAPVVQAFVHVS